MAELLADIAKRESSPMHGRAVLAATLGAAAIAVVGAWLWSGRDQRALTQRTSDRLAPRNSRAES